MNIGQNERTSQVPEAVALCELASDKAAVFLVSHSVKKCSFRLSQKEEEEKREMEERKRIEEKEEEEYCMFQPRCLYSDLFCFSLSSFSSFSQ